MLRTAKTLVKPITDLDNWMKDKGPNNKTVDKVNIKIVDDKGSDGANNLRRPGPNSSTSSPSASLVRGR